MTDDLVARLKERMAVATPGPWQVFGGTVSDFDREYPCSLSMEWVPNAVGEDEDARSDENAYLIVDAVNALPALIARIEALEAAMIQARSDLHLVMLGTKEWDTFHAAKDMRDRVHAALTDPRHD